MTKITQQYLDSLPDIYKKILQVFPKFDPTRKAGYSLAFQSIYTSLDEKFTFGEIKQACESLEEGKAVEIKNKIFVHPTPLGEEIMTALTGKQAPEQEPAVPPFSPPLPITGLTATKYKEG